MGTSFFCRLKLKFLDTVWALWWNEISETLLRIYRTPLFIFQEIMIIHRISCKMRLGNQVFRGHTCHFLNHVWHPKWKNKYPKNLFHIYMTPLFIFQEIILLLCLRSFSFLGTYWPQWFKWHFQNVQIIIPPKSYSMRW